MKKQKRILAFSKPIRISLSIYPSTLMGILVFFVSSIYLAFLVASSQSFSSCLEQLEYYRKTEEIYKCIKKTSNTTYFDMLYERYRQYIPLLKSQVEQEKNINLEKIKYYESLMEYNSKSRDLLLTLSKLYLEQGNIPYSNYYLNQAKMIDPQLNNSY